MPGATANRLSLLFFYIFLLFFHILGRITPVSLYLFSRKFYFILCTHKDIKRAPES